MMSSWLMLENRKDDNPWQCILCMEKPSQKNMWKKIHELQPEHNLWLYLPQYVKMGSMKNNTADNNAVKDFYSYEEASKFTKKDFDKNPALHEAVKKSMPKW